MATVLRVWTVEDGGLTEIPDLPADQQGLIEAKLEDWLASQPDAIEVNLLIIGRQVSTSSGPLDLIGQTASRVKWIVASRLGMRTGHATWQSPIGQQ